MKPPLRVEVLIITIREEKVGEKLVIRVVELAPSLHEKMVERRRQLHQRTELSFREHDTSRRVSERLRELGVRVTEGVGGNGVVGRRKDAHSSSR